MRILAAAVLVLVLAAGAQAASRPASTTEAQSFRRDVASFVTRNAAPGVRFAISRVRISRTNPRWAAARVSAPGLDTAGLLAHKVGGRWRGVALGTSGVGCAAPPAVRVDLGLDC